MQTGKKVVLTAVERGDLEQLLAWRNKEEFRKHFREYRELNMAQQERWFNEKVNNDPTTIMFSIRRRSDNELLGCCGLVYVNWVHRHADLSLYIGWKDSYIDEEGYAEEACALLFDYAFNALSLNKIWTEIYVFDTKKKKLYDRIGLKVDGVLRQNYYYDGKWVDSYILSILASDWSKGKGAAKKAGSKKLPSRR
ncbi:MAG: GNAT family N-acetyltransferase [Candidatus Saganbacteria bacterium]|nr:GNAT family N-acetyltransferase [Candidatus Saganbacteria bacterium]